MPPFGGGAATSVAVLRRIASSLAPFTGSITGAPTFKAISTGGGELAISCDPLEVVDALGLEDASVAAEILREGLDGLCVADFGRAQQAQLAVLTAGLLAEAAGLLESGVPPWTLCSALRRAERLARATCDKLASERLATEVLRHLAGGADREEDEGSDVAWFFEASEREPLEPARPGPPPCPAPRVCGEAASLDEACTELQMRHGRAASEQSGGQSRHCFIYASVRPRQVPSCEVVRGIVCHVPRRHVTARADVLWKPLPPLMHALFIDADLNGAAYDSCAPAARRLVETALLPAAGLPFMGSVGAARDAALGSAVHALLTSRGVGAVFLAGWASPEVAGACRRAGALLVAALPVRLLHALAAELGAEVLHGLPESAAGLAGVASAPTERPLWQASEAVCCEFRELSAEERRGCFAFPLLGHRQPLLPHQNGVGEDVEGPCWELRARAQRGGAASTLVLEAACEPVLRQLHAELNDKLFEALRCAEEGAGTRRLPAGGAWARAVAEALDGDAALIAVAPAEEDAEEPHVAPWLAPAGSALAEAAVMAGLAAAFQRAGELEAELADLDVDAPEAPDSAARAVGGPLDVDGGSHEEKTVSHDAATAVVRRAIQTVQVLVNLCEGD